MKVKIDIEDFAYFCVHGNTVVYDHDKDLEAHKVIEILIVKIKNLQDLDDVSGHIPRDLVIEGFEEAWKHINCENQDKSELCCGHNTSKDVEIEWFRPGESVKDILCKNIYG